VGGGLITGKHRNGCHESVLWFFCSSYVGLVSSSTLKIREQPIREVIVTAFIIILSSIFFIFCFFRRRCSGIIYFLFLFFSRSVYFSVRPQLVR
jgi:hypothetical protein